MRSKIRKTKNNSQRFHLKKDMRLFLKSLHTEIVHFKQNIGLVRQKNVKETPDQKRKHACYPKLGAKRREGVFKSFYHFRVAFEVLLLVLLWTHANTCGQHERVNNRTLKSIRKRFILSTSPSFHPSPFTLGSPSDHPPSPSTIALPSHT